MTIATSPANIAVYVSKLGGKTAVISKTGIGAFGTFLKSELRRHGVDTGYLIMDHRNRTTVIFLSSTAGGVGPSRKTQRGGDDGRGGARGPGQATRPARRGDASSHVQGVGGSSKSLEALGRAKRSMTQSASTCARLRL